MFVRFCDILIMMCTYSLSIISFIERADLSQFYVWTLKESKDRRNRPRRFADIKQLRVTYARRRVALKEQTSYRSLPFCHGSCRVSDNALRRTVISGEFTDDVARVWSTELRMHCTAWRVGNRPCVLSRAADRVFSRVSHLVSRDFPWKCVAILTMNLQSWP